MNTFELEIWDDEGEKVTFYTVRFDGTEASETDKFFQKYGKSHRQEVQQLLSLILKAIGDEYGALDEFFNRSEKTAFSGYHHTVK